MILQNLIREESERAGIPYQTLINLYLTDCAKNKGQLRTEWEKAEKAQDMNACAYYEFAVLWEGRHAAAISLYPDEARETAELGWITNKAYWGHGIAFEAVQAVLRFAADELHIHRFIAHCDTENTASFHFMEKLGMTRIAEYGGRRNKGSDEERREYEYELKI